MKKKETSNNRFRVMEVILLIALAMFLASSAAAFQTQEELAEKVVRLHVLANSDSEADQALKLQVRDAVLARAEYLLKDATDRREAEGILRGQLLEFESIAQDVIQAAGYDDSVIVELTNTEFPTKRYTGFVFPAGEYLALRVLIGEAEGQNWWCVVYPPLCAAATTDLENTALSAGFSEDEISLITEDGPRYELKFRTLELWEAVRQGFKKV